MHLIKTIAQSLLAVLISSTIIIYPMKRSRDSMEHNVVYHDSLSQALIDAACDGQLNLIQSLETKHHIANEQFMTCFFYAAESGHIGILDYIAQKVGVSCLKADSAPYVALQSAAKYGRIEVIKFILELGIHYVNDPLITAIDNGHADIVQELIKNGANINGDHYHIKPSSTLGYAVQKNYLDVIKTLLKHGARIHKNEWEAIQTTHRIDPNVHFIISYYFPYLNEPFVSLEKTYYAILGIPKNASASVIKQAYYALAKQYHPDRGGTTVNTEIFKVINNAYECLSDPSKKRLYDLNCSCCCSSSEEHMLLPACQACRKDCFVVTLKSYPHPCCDNSTVLCDYCEKRHAQASKDYLHCCDK